MEMISNSIVTLLGFEDVNYVSRKTGETVIGTKIWYSATSENERVKGLITGDAYIKKSLPFLNLNSQYRLIYSMFLFNGQQVCKVTDIEQL